MPDTINSRRNNRNYLTGLLLFGMLGLGTLSITSCDSSTPPSEPLAENDLTLNNPPPASPLNSDAISSLPTPSIRPSAYTSAPASPTAGLTPPSPVALAPKPKPSYVRPTTAENGQPFPATSGYIKKYQQKANDGYSSLTIKNDQNDSDVYVKVFDLNKSKAKPVRFFFVRAHESFTAEKITPGKYDVRYKDLDSGSLNKSEEFPLTETKDGEGVNYSTITMTLYKVANGNMKTEAIDEESFE
jgi:hypothetical protein